MEWFNGKKMSILRVNAFLGESVIMQGGARSEIDCIHKLSWRVCIGTSVWLRRVYCISTHALRVQECIPTGQCADWIPHKVTYPHSRGWFTPAFNMLISWWSCSAVGDGGVAATQSPFHSPVMWASCAVREIQHVYKTNEARVLSSAVAEIGAVYVEHDRFHEQYCLSCAQLRCYTVITNSQKLNILSIT